MHPLLAVPFAAVIAERRAALTAAISRRLTPEHTRRPNLFERLTVRRLDEHRLLQAHAWLEFLGKVTFGLYCGFIATVLLGVEWRATVESALNAGRPIKGAVVLVFVVPTLLFVALRSMIGYLRWRVQRELWRRDVERLSGPGPSSA